MLSVRSLSRSRAFVGARCCLFKRYKIVNVASTSWISLAISQLWRLAKFHFCSQVTLVANGCKRVMNLLQYLSRYKVDFFRWHLAAARDLHNVSDHVWCDRIAHSSRWYRLPEWWRFLPAIDAGRNELPWDRYIIFCRNRILWSFCKIFLRNVAFIKLIILYIFRGRTIHEHKSGHKQMRLGILLSRTDLRPVSNGFPKSSSSWLRCRMILDVLRRVRK